MHPYLDEQIRVMTDHLADEARHAPRRSFATRQPGQRDGMARSLRAGVAGAFVGAGLRLHRPAATAAAGCD